MTRLYVVRHINTTGNSDGIFQGRIDTPPSELGKIQLSELKERFRGRNLDVVYMSPLGRTIKTAEAVNFYSKAPMVPDESLIEINGGKFEGMTFDEIMAKYPDYIKYIDRDVHKFCAVEGESVKDVYERTTPALWKIIKKNKGRKIAVVSHAIAIKSMLTGVLGIPFEKMEEHIPFIKNASVTRIDFDDSLVPNLVYLSDIHFQNTTEKNI